MLVRGSKLVLHILAASLIGLMLFGGAVVWQLSRGPISVAFLTPYIEDALNPANSPVRIRLGETILTWGGLERTLDVRAVGLDVIAADGSALARVPEISVRFSARALLNGLIAPTSLELLGPRVRIIRGTEGALALDMATDGTTDGATDIPERGRFAELLQQFLAEPDPMQPLGYLRRIAISSALVEYEDRQSGTRLTAPRVNLALERDDEGIRAAGSIAVDLAGRPVGVQVSGILSARSGASEIGLSFADFEPSTLTALSPKFTFLDNVEMPINGTVTLSLTRNFDLEDIGFDIDAARGTIALPALYAAPKEITGLQVRGRARDDFRTVVLEDSRFELDGAQVTLAGTMVRRGQRMVADFDAGLRGLAVDDIADWWPEGVETNARTWITQNLRDGTVELARINVGVSMPIDDPLAFSVSDIGGRIDATGVTVHYLRPMDPVRGVNAVGTFDESGFTVDATSGSVRQMKLESGRIRIAGLDGDPKGHRINIDLTIAGAVRGALELLDQKPLQFVRRVDIAPKEASGNHRTQLIVQFPLLDALKFEDIRVAAASRLNGFALTRGPMGLPLGDGDLSLQIDTEKMIVDGNVGVSGVPAGVAWTEWFAGKVKARRTYQVRAILNDDARARLGLDLSPWLSGPVGIGLTYSEATIGAVSGAAEIDASSAAMTVDEVGWSKSAGVPARAFLRFSGERGQIRRFDRFTMSAADLVVEGSATLRATAGAGIAPSRVTLKRLAFGGTDLFGAAEFATDGSVDVSLGGRQLDLRREVAAVGEADDDAAATTRPPRPIRIDISKAAPIGTVRLGEKTTLADLRGTLAVTGTEIRQASLVADLNGKGAVTLDIGETGTGRDVRFVAQDGGDLIDAFEVTDTILGGRLELRGTIADAREPETFVGQLQLTDFRLTENSGIARAFTLASFSGAGDAVRDNGLAMQLAEVPLTFSRDEIVITEAKLRGADVGVLATGRIDRKTDTIALAGEVAPAYTLNSLLGNIPLIGTLLTGGGDGVFAASYEITGPLANPDVRVNPLTVLTPGIIRRLLTGFGSDNQAAPADGSAPAIPQSPAR